MIHLACTRAEKKAKGGGVTLVNSSKKRDVVYLNYFKRFVKIHLFITLLLIVQSSNWKLLAYLILAIRRATVDRRRPATYFIMNKIAHTSRRRGRLSQKIFIVSSGENMVTLSFQTTLH